MGFRKKYFEAIEKVITVFVILKNLAAFDTADDDMI
jgi:hypothetical protein